MKIKVISDIHLEKCKEYPGVSRFLGDCIHPPDIICLCGDIGDPKQPMYSQFLMDCANICQLRTFVLLGNHEFYGSNIASTKKGVYDICSHHEKLVLLDNTMHVVNGITFLGTTLWSRIDTQRTLDIAFSINDYHRIQGWTVQTCLETFHQNRQWLVDCLSLCQNTDVIILTHHVPLLGIGNPAYAHGRLESAFASNMIDIMMAYNDRIRYWFYGHNHYSEHTTVHDIHVVSNQVGGIRFDPHFMIEV